MEKLVNEQFAVPVDAEYVKNYGHVLRNLLNGVKQDASSFAQIHGLDAQYLEEVMNGKKPLTQEIIKAIMNHSPLNVHLLFDPKHRSRIPVHDDTIKGVVICRHKQTMDTKRTFNRGHQKVPYYDYGDTAMSRTSPFRPEWIKELYVHDGEDPNVPDWAFNKGHFEFQMTYFIGHVNFHWIDNDGKMHVRQMNTGDINYITPFVPHTFSTRKEGEGLILAVTYGGAISAEDVQSGIQSLSLQNFLAQIKDKLPQPKEHLPTDELGGVIVRRNSDSALKNEDHYSIKILMDSIPYQPYTRALEYDIKASSDKKLDIQSDGRKMGV